MTPLRLLWFGLALGTCACAESNAWNVVLKKDRSDWIELPKTAIVKNEDTSGQTWRQTGELRGSLPVARRDFENSFRRQGWRLRHVIPTTEGRAKSEVIVWEKSGREMLVFLAEEGGVCSFSIGENEAAKP